MRPWITLATTLLLAASMTAMAQDAADPAIGTWTLNLAKSKYLPAGSAPKSETRTYEATADGMIHMTVQQVSADGQSSTFTSTYKRDGKPYPYTGSPNVDQLAVSPRNSKGEVVSTTYRGGKIVGHTTAVFSEGGKVMTQSRTIKNVSGQSEKDTRVYDKQ